MVFGAILAGGVGSRLGADIPKQFLMLGEKPIIIYSLEKFLACSRMDAVFIGVHPDYLQYTQELVARYVPENQNRVHILPGGGSRNDTLQNIIAAIDLLRQDSPEDIIVTHDAARPILTMRMLEENIDAAIEYGAVNTVCAATDTIVISQDGVTIEDIPNKAVMYYGHSPQSFRINMLKDLYSTLTQEEKDILTDACKICCLRGQQVALVRSEYTNLKITTSGDYIIAQAFIAQGVDKKD